MLQAEGLVDAIAQPGRGGPRRTTTEDLDDLYQLRALLEGYAARRAATRISEEALQRLKASCDRFEVARARRGASRARRARTCSSTARSSTPRAARRLASMVRKVIELPLVYKSYIWYSPDQKRISAHYHRQIVERARGPRRASARSWS